MMQIFGLQLDIAWEDRATNHAAVTAMLQAAPPPRGALVILPEMFASGFSMNVAAIAEADERASERFIETLAKRWGVTIIAGIVTKVRGAHLSAGRGDKAFRGFNEAIICSEHGQAIMRYRKMHPFSLAGETEHYLPGDNIGVFDWHGITVSPLICYDLRFPEIFRRATRRGAEMFAVIANWPAARIEHWTALLRARAIENQAYVVGVNRCGTDPKLIYPGRSILFDPNGTIIAELGDGPAVLRASVEAKSVRDFRRKLPFLEDMRDDLLAP
jgi:predicted amidohydrolase